MSRSTMLFKAGAVSLALVAAGCSNMNWSTPTGGNMTTWATGSYRMPPRDTSQTAQVRSTGDATSADTRVRSSLPDNKSKIAAAQQALTQSGYDPGHADGVWDESTQTAVRKFQEARGLRSTGELDAATMAALGVPLQ